LNINSKVLPSFQKITEEYEVKDLLPSTEPQITNPVLADCIKVRKKFFVSFHSFSLGK
jgi:hypothetical protein